MQARSVKVGSWRIGGRQPLALIAGPCVIESRTACLELAERLDRLARRRRIPWVFKASYDKANRTSADSFRGPGLVRGLEILAEIKARFEVPVLTDVHAPEHVGPAAEVCDILQLPAFLCRQTDLVTALGESGRAVNIKKAQFMAPWDVQPVIEKVERTGNRRILLTERGVSFGYNTLVADMRSLLEMRSTGYPVVFDATHSVQRPGGGGDRSTGDGRWAPALARAAVAVGCDAVFVETHPRPEEALSDRDNAIPLKGLGPLWSDLAAIEAARGGPGGRGR